jgi:hypothetical protein
MTVAVTHVRRVAAPEIEELTASLAPSPAALWTKGGPVT